MKRLDNKTFLTRLLSNFSVTELSKTICDPPSQYVVPNMWIFPLSHGQLLSLRPQIR